MGDVFVFIPSNAGMEHLLNSEDGDVAKWLLKKSLIVERLAKTFAPVKTGLLRSSITHQLARDSQGLFAKIGSNVSYAKWQELGTKSIAAKAFLRRALQQALRGGGVTA